MLKSLKKLVAQSPLLQVTSFNSLSISIKLVSSLVVAKLSAILLGTQGVALIGNMRNALSIFHNFASGGLDKAVVKYTSDTHLKPAAYQVFISTLFWVFVGLSIIVFTVVFVFSKSLSTLVFNDVTYAFVFKWTALLLPIYALNVYILNILKGLSQFKHVIRIHIFSHLLNLIVFTLLIYTYDLSGALMAVVVVPSASLVFSFVLASRYLDFSTVNFKVFSILQLKNFGQYAFMTLISAVTFPMVYLGIRQYLTTHIDIDAAGYWEANFRLSTFYLVFMQSLLNLYILPKLVEAKTQKGFQSTVLEFYKQIIPLFAVGLLLVFLLKKYIILLVFSEEFLPVKSLLGWQIIADFFRILALVMAYQFHAKKMLWHYVITDLLLALGLYFSAVFFVDIYNLKGVVIGHAITYILYFVMIALLFRKPILNPKV